MRTQIQNIFDLFQILLEVSFSTDTGWKVINGYSCHILTNEHRLYYLVSEQPPDKKELDKIQARIRETYLNIVRLLSQRWSKPLFQDIELDEAHSEPNLERLEEAIYLIGGMALAYWQNAKYLMYVELEQPNDEIPLSLILGVKLMT